VTFIEFGVVFGLRVGDFPHHRRGTVGTTPQLRGLELRMRRDARRSMLTE